MQIRYSYGGGKSEFYERHIGYHLNPNASLWFPVTRQTNTGVGEKNGKGAINPSSNKLDQQIEMYPRSIKSM